VNNDELGRNALIRPFRDEALGGTDLSRWDLLAGGVTGSDLQFAGLHELRFGPPRPVRRSSVGS
jgi:hypothetical protein